MEYRRLSHCVYHAQYHVVFGTKYRRHVLKPGVKEYALTLMKKITRLFPEVEIITSNAEEDHVHLFLSIPPKHAVSEVVGLIKGQSAYALRKKFPFLNKVYWGTDGIWSDGYFVSTTGANEETIKRYIEMQGKEDSGQAKLVF
jgi:putative transposase